MLQFLFLIVILCTDVNDSSRYAANEHEQLVATAKVGNHPVPAVVNMGHLSTPLLLTNVTPLFVRSRPVRAAGKRKRRRRKKKRKRRRKRKKKRRRKRRRKKRKRRRKGKVRKSKGKRRRRRKKKRKQKKKRRRKFGKRRRKMNRKRRRRRRRRRRRKMRRKKFRRKKFGRKRRRKMRRRKKTRRLRPSSKPYVSHVILNLTGRRKSLSKSRKKIPTFLVPYGRFPPRKVSKTLNRGGTAASHLLNVMDRLITKVIVTTVNSVTVFQFHLTANLS